MTRTEKNVLIGKIRATINMCLSVMINLPKNNGHKDSWKTAGDELRRIAKDLDCDSTPEYKLNAYSTRTLTILEHLLGSAI